RECPLGGLRVRSDLLRRRRAGDHRAHDWVREQPRDGELPHLMATLTCERAPAIELREVLLGEEPRALRRAPEARVRRGRHTTLVLPGEEAAGERRVRHERETEVFARRHHVLLDRALEEAVLHLRYDHL